MILLVEINSVDVQFILNKLALTVEDEDGNSISYEIKFKIFQAKKKPCFKHILIG